MKIGNGKVKGQKLYVTNVGDKREYSLEESNNMCKYIGDKKNVKNAHSKSDANEKIKPVRHSPYRRDRVN
jgi:hypothetical protein